MLHPDASRAGARRAFTKVVVVVVVPAGRLRVSPRAKRGVVIIRDAGARQDKKLFLPSTTSHHSTRPSYQRVPERLGGVALFSTTSSFGDIPFSVSKKRCYSRIRVALFDSRSRENLRAASRFDRQPK